MREKRRSVTAAILAVLLCFSCFAGCSKNNSARPETGSEEQNNQMAFLHAEKQVQEDWYQLLETAEEIYSDVFWILDQLDVFICDNSWNSLLKARAACSSAMIAFQELEIPSLDVTQEDCALLMQQGIEINVIQREFESLEMLRDNMTMTVSYFQEMLERDVFLAVNLSDAMPVISEFYREYFTREYRYLCQLTNYLLIQMEDPELWQTWTGKLPCMNACADRWYETTTEVEEATGVVLDEMEQLQTRLGSVQGISQYTLEIVQGAVATGDIAVLQRECNTILDVPGYYPVPFWISDQLPLYYVIDASTGENRLIKPGEESFPVPSGCMISCGKIPVDEVLSYETNLKKWNIEVSGTWNTAKDSYRLTANDGSSTLTIQWTEEEALLTFTETIGCLIPELYLFAMHRN